MLNTKSENPNYLAKIVKLPELREHPNADRLALVTIDGQVVITSKDAVVGELYVYFPLECAIDGDFLSFCNAYSDCELNADKKQKGFFSKNRVKATKLRGILSEGYLHPVKSVNEWLVSAGLGKHQIEESDVGTEFDSFGDHVFVKKYINQEVLRKAALAAKRAKGGGKVKRESRLVDNQFRLHPDSKHLKREIRNINSEDWIEVSAKYHGANGVLARILTKKQLGWKDRVAKFFGVQIEDKEYDLCYASRRVIKNSFADQKTNDFYDANVWEIVAKRYSESLRDGITLYGEVVGYTPTGAGIQGKYDYGCEVGKCEFYVFRITYTSPSGDVHEFSMPQVIDYCDRLGLKHVPVHYVGQAKNMYPQIATDSHWHENFLAKLMEDYLEKDCEYCKNKVPDEGVVVSKRLYGTYEGYKLKSSRFILQESADLDKGVSNIEDEESVETTNEQE